MRCVLAIALSAVNRRLIRVWRGKYVGRVQQSGKTRRIQGLTLALAVYAA